MAIAVKANTEQMIIRIRCVTLSLIRDFTWVFGGIEGKFNGSRYSCPALPCVTGSNVAQLSLSYAFQTGSASGRHWAGDWKGEEKNPACFSPSVSASSGPSSNSCILSGCPDPIRKSLT